MKTRRTVRSIVDRRSAAAVMLAAWCLWLDRGDGSLDWSVATALITAVVVALHLSLRSRPAARAG
jgi:hypothetical protein